jgi:hypothetical protein
MVATTFMQDGRYFGENNIGLQLLAVIRSLFIALGVA